MGERWTRIILMLQAVFEWVRTKPATLILNSNLISLICCVNVATNFISTLGQWSNCPVRTVEGTLVIIDEPISENKLIFHEPSGETMI